MILRGEGSGSEVPMLKGVMLGPLDALVHIFLADSEAFHLDLRAIIHKYFQTIKYEMDDQLLDEIIRYQKARMLVWPIPSQNPTFEFVYNVPEYFDDMTDEVDVPPFSVSPNVMEVVIPADLGDTYEEFSASRVMGGMMMKLYDVVYKEVTVPVPA